MSSEKYIHHEINYVEFGALDFEATKKFYGSAFGWKFNDYGPEYMGVQRQDGNGEVGGFFLADEVNAGGPLVILYSEDLDQTFEAVKEAGGKIAKEIVSFPGGRRFQFCDPSGHELAVWSNKNPDGSLIELQL